MPELKDFEGKWILSRRVGGKNCSFHGRLIGTSTFKADATGLTYDEIGQLRLLGAAPMTAQRRHLWRCTDDDIVVLFEDGRAFHRFDRRVDRSSGRHECSPDLYIVRYDFRRWPVWYAAWRIIGPRKDCVIVSAYRPDTGACGPGVAEAKAD